MRAPSGASKFVLLKVHRPVFHQTRTQSCWLSARQPLCGPLTFPGYSTVVCSIRNCGLLTTNTCMSAARIWIGDHLHRSKRWAFCWLIAPAWSKMSIKYSTCTGIWEWMMPEFHPLGQMVIVPNLMRRIRLQSISMMNIDWTRTFR